MTIKLNWMKKSFDFCYHPDLGCPKKERFIHPTLCTILLVSVYICIFLCIFIYLCGCQKAFVVCKDKRIKYFCCCCCSRIFHILFAPLIGMCGNQRFYAQPAISANIRCQQWNDSRIKFIHLCKHQLPFYSICRWCKQRLLYSKIQSTAFFHYCWLLLSSPKVDISNRAISNARISNLRIVKMRFHFIALYFFLLSSLALLYHKFFFNLIKWLNFSVHFITVTIEALVLYWFSSNDQQNYHFIVERCSKF